MNARSPAKFADIKEMSFERALKELETIVGRLERVVGPLARLGIVASAGNRLEVENSAGCEERGE